MSEISDAVQIIRVGYDTIEIAMKVGSGSIEMMQKAVNLLIGLLEHEKTMGKTNMKGLLEKDFVTAELGVYRCLPLLMRT